MSQKRNHKKVKQARRANKDATRSKSRRYKQLAHQILVEEMIKNEMEKLSEPS